MNIFKLFSDAGGDHLVLLYEGLALEEGRFDSDVIHLSAYVTLQLHEFPMVMSSTLRKVGLSASLIL